MSPAMLSSVVAGALRAAMKYERPKCAWCCEPFARDAVRYGLDYCTRACMEYGHDGDAEFAALRAEGAL